MTTFKTIETVRFNTQYDVGITPKVTPPEFFLGPMVRIDFAHLNKPILASSTKHSRNPLSPGDYIVNGVCMND